VEKALKFDGHELRNRALRVSKAVKKQKVKGGKPKKSQGKRQRAPPGQEEPKTPEPDDAKGSHPPHAHPRKSKTTSFEKKNESFTGDQLSEIGKLKVNYLFRKY
jgi:hypothetical protein